MKEYEIIKKLINSDKNKKVEKFWSKIFSPYYFFMEYYCRKKIWSKFIFEKLITTDEIFNFLDKQDFEIVDKRFVKTSLLEEHPNYVNDMGVMKEMILRDYIEAFINLFRKNIPFDVENYTNINVEFGDKIVKSYGEIYHSVIYIVTLQYWREDNYKSAKKVFYVWLLVLSLIITLATIIIKIIL